MYQTISSTGMLNQNGQPANSQPAISATGILNQPSAAPYVPKPINIGMAAAEKPDADWVNQDKAKAKAEAEANKPPPESGKIICIKWHELGFMDDETARLDQLYGQWLLKNDRPFMLGYLSYAKHVVAVMHYKTWQSRLFVNSIGWLVNPWAKEMASRMDSTRDGSKFGVFLMWFFHEFWVLAGKYRSLRLRYKSLLTKLL